MTLRSLATMPMTADVVAAIAVAISVAIAIGVIAAWRRSSAPATGAADVSAFTVVRADGTSHPLTGHRGRVLLLVNTATGCHFARQFAGLETLHERYHDRGLDVIGIPSNDFLGQEPRGDGEMASFCNARYAVAFPLMAKARVRGAEQIPLYRWLTRESGHDGRIAWNFTKFVVGRDGRVVGRFGPTTDPLAPALIGVIESALAATQP